MTALVIRASSLPQFPDCGRRWAARNLRDEIEAAGYKLRTLPPSIGAAIGTGTHAAAAHELTHKMEHGDLGNPDHAEQRGIQALEEELEGGAVWDEISPNKAFAQRQVVKQARSYRAGVSERVKPVAVERRLKATFRGLTISGQQDLVVAEPDTLRDLKTGRIQRSNGAQYGTYTRLLRAHGKPVTKIIEDFVMRVGIAKEQPPPVEIEYDVAASERQTETILKRIEADVAAWRGASDPESFLANPSSFLCGDKWCPAWGTAFCTAHRGAK